MDDSDKLIKTEIKRRVVTYYLANEDDLESVKSNSLLGDIFAVITSIAIGGIVSVLLTKATGIDLQTQTLNILDILLWVFIAIVLIFGLFTGYFYSKSFGTIKKIKNSGTVESLKSDDNQAKVIKEGDSTENQLKIISATYFTNKKSLDVTDEIRKKIIDNKIESVTANNIKYDPDPGTPKKLNIKYNINGVTVTKQFKEDDKVVIP